jgi:diguanylate cyclase (GGDEF)-like protein
MNLPIAVWSLIGLILAGAAVVAVASHLTSAEGIGRELVPWWGLTLAMVAAEMMPVHLSIRRHTWSASLIEIPLVMGLTMSAPREVVLAQVGGCVLARGLIRRQALEKLAFNVSLCALESVSAIWVFETLARHDSLTAPAVWLAAYAAIVTEGVVSTAGLVAVMTLVTGDIPAGLLPNFVLGAIVVPAASTAIALQASILVVTDPVAAILLVIVATLLVIGYRAFTSLRARYASLELLYQFTDAIQQTTYGASTADRVLRSTREVLNAGIAELVIRDGSGGFHRFLSRDSEPGAPEQQVLEVAPPSWRVVDLPLDGLLSPKGTRDEVGNQWLLAGSFVDGMVVPLRRGDETIGTLAVANRLGEVATFDRNDLRLLGTLANHASVSIENSNLIRQLTFDATHDSLTGLANRTGFYTRLGQSLAARAPGRKIAVALIDLDRFKEVNDTLGHHVGDDLLEWLGDRIARGLPEQACAARLGGDEFAFFVEFEGSKADSIDEIGHFVDPLWREPFRVNGAEVTIDVRGSVGVAVAPDDAEDAPTLLQRADVAMYMAKGKRGAGYIAPYRPDLDTNSAQKLALAAELREAINDGELQVCFQPQLDLATGRITGAEALVRWSHPTRGPITPDVFIPLAEQTGQIVSLTHLVLDRALRSCRVWALAGTDLSVAVNVSVRSLSDLGIVETVQTLLRLHDVQPERLIIEVTESGIMEDEVRDIGVLEALAGLGVRVAVDDFGTGYSSLTYLSRLPLQEVKVDKSFVIGMEDNAKNAAIVRSVIELAHNLDLEVVAEGVETAASLKELARLGCTTAQGFYISRAVPAQDVLDTIVGCEELVLRTAGTGRERRAKLLAV